MTKQEGYELMKLLVAKFEQNLTAYKNIEYNETETRNEFIDPFWEALGWDMQNKKQAPPRYKEVQVEKTQKTEGKNKKPDYTFRGSLYQNTYFYVEAKKPSINLKQDLAPLLQVKNYGWQGKLKISIVMDFEEFVVVNTTKAPRKNDTLKSCTHQYFTYKDYITKFDFFWNTFSKESVNQGSIDNYTRNIQEASIRESVDVNFLNTLERWRKYLATDIAQKNKNLEDFELNTLVQQTIDRIIFLKIAEDRNIEFPNQLLEASKKTNIYQNLFQLFVEADQRYNSGLFDFKKNNIAQNVKIDNKILKNIIKELYEGNEEDDFLAYPYDFSIIPVEILGYAYEQFLGNVIVIDESGKAIIEQKAEVRKAGGVYYTPVEIVRYIVAETIGKKIAGKTPSEILNMTCLDPSCGSGSFLLGAYDFLLKWYLEYYISLLNLGKKVPELTPNNELTTQVKKDILLRHIFGVDIDEQAVEVTKLSLLIKCLEGETRGSIETQTAVFKQKVLPSLEENILCGNSLIGSNFYEGKLFPTPREMRKINVFDWHIGFKNQLKKGGFEVIIGNPPYVGSKEILETQKQYFRDNYACANHQFDLYALFIEKALKLLQNTENVFLSMIIPDAILDRSGNEFLRNFILNQGKITDIVQINNVFDQANVSNVIIQIQKKSANSTFLFKKVKNLFDFQEGIIKVKEISIDFYKNTPNNAFLFISKEEFNILEKIKHKKVFLENIALLGRGEEIGKSANIILKKPYRNTKQFLSGEEVGRYKTIYNKKFIRIKDIQKRQSLYDKKIIVRQVGSEINASYDSEGCVTLQSIYSVILQPQYNPYYILGILNSKLMSFLYAKLYRSKDIFPRILLESLKQLPIQILDLKDKTQKIQHDKVVEFAQKILQLNVILSETKLANDKDMYQRMIQNLENDLNNYVYQIYNLTLEEIEIIENGE